MKDTEELVDFYIHRPLAQYVARALAPTGVTPNGVTIAGGVLGVAAGFALWRSTDEPGLRLVAAALLFASVVLDCADGQLARLKNQASRAGVILDGAIDAVVGFATILAATHLVAAAYPGWHVWALGAFAMASSEAQCFLFDVAKERYVTAQQIAYAPGKLRMSIEAEARPPDPGENAFLVRRFNDYAALVRSMSAATGDGRPDPFTRRHIRAWTTIGLGTHFALLYAAAALAYVWLPALMVCLLIYSTVMNVVLVSLLWARPMRFSG